MRVRLQKIVIIAAAVLTLAGCGVMSELGEGDSVLSRNTVRITSECDVDPSSLQQYIKQQSASFSLFDWDRTTVIFNPEAVDESIENIKSHLEYLGYYRSEVQSEVRPLKKEKKSSADKVEVIYKVTPGVRYTIDSLTFDLPSRGGFAADFERDRPYVTVRVGDFLSEEKLEAETVRGAAHFRDLGYYGFSKSHYSFVADTLTVPGKLILEMKVSEQSRNESAVESEPLRIFTIDSVSISYPAGLSVKEKVLRELNTLHPGDIYSESEVSRTYSRLSSLRLFNSVGIEMNRTDTSLVNCAITLSPSRLQGFKADLEASTNSSGLVGVSPQLSYYHKNVFHAGEWLNVSLMGNSQFKIGDKARARELGLSASLSFPRFLGLPYRIFHGSNIPRTEINASYNYQDRPEYTRTIFSTSLGYTGSYRHLSYQLYPLQLSIVRLDDMDEAFYDKLTRNPFMRYTYLDHFDAGVGGTLYYSSSDEVNPTESWHYVRFSTDISGGILSLFKPLMVSSNEGEGLILGIPYSQYQRTELTLGRTWMLGDEGTHSIATRLMGGLGHAYGNSTVLPFEKQFWAGGAGSMRGWQSRALGPGCSQMDETFVIPSQTGDVKLEANVEYRFPLVWKLEGALFADAGNVWTLGQDDPVSDFSLSTLGRSIAADWGVGARVNLGFIVVRVDMGMKLREPSREKPWLSPAQWLQRDGFALHFGVGYPF